MPALLFFVLCFFVFNSKTANAITCSGPGYSFTCGTAFTDCQKCLAAFNPPAPVTQWEQYCKTCGGTKYQECFRKTAGVPFMPELTGWTKCVTPTYNCANFTSGYTLQGVQLRQTNYYYSTLASKQGLVVSCNNGQTVYKNIAANLKQNLWNDNVSGFNAIPEFDTWLHGQIVQGWDVGFCGDTCGGSSTANVCTPKTCSQMGYNCGMADDGCGNKIFCGSCASNICINYQCGSVPTSNTPLSDNPFNNGTASGGNGDCTPATCGSLGYGCGVAGDGCGHNLNCGSCASGQACQSNQCVTQTTAATAPTVGTTGLTLDQIQQTIADIENQIAALIAQLAALKR